MPGLQTCRAIEENVVPDHVLVEQSHAGANDGLAVLIRVLGESDLRRKIHIGLFNRITDSRGRQH